MDTTHLVKLISGIIGIVFGTLFMIIHIIKKRNNVQYFSHNQKAETIVGHIQKFYIFMVSVFFYIIGFSGFISLIFNTSN